MTSSVKKLFHTKYQPVRHPSTNPASGIPLMAARQFEQADLSKRSKSFALASALRQRK